MTITTFSSKEELTSAAAALLIEAIRLNPDTVLGLSTGNSPIGIYEKLVRDHIQNGTSYKSVTTFNLDEYVGLDGASEHSYRYFMDKHLFDHLNINKSNTYVPSGIGNLEENCRIYEEIVKNKGGIAIQLIGIGTNGHIAFNEPGTPFDSRTHITELSQETIEANAIHFPSKEDIPTRAVTMGIQSILDAKWIIMVAFGKNKAKAIREMIKGEISPDMPASILQKHPNVTVLLDTEAASLL
jgi:glucosamine-6-phosphate deaminase